MRDCREGDVAAAQFARKLFSTGRGWDFRQGSRAHYIEGLMNPVAAERSGERTWTT